MKGYLISAIIMAMATAHEFKAGSCPVYTSTMPADRFN